MGIEGGAARRYAQHRETKAATPLVTLFDRTVKSLWRASPLSKDCHTVPCSAGHTSLLRFVLCLLTTAFLPRWRRRQVEGSRLFQGLCDLGRVDRPPSAWQLGLPWKVGGRQGSCPRAGASCRVSHRLLAAPGRQHVAPRSRDSFHLLVREVHPAGSGGLQTPTQGRPPGLCNSEGARPTLHPSLHSVVFSPASLHRACPPATVHAVLQPALAVSPSRRPQPSPARHRAPLPLRLAGQQPQSPPLARPLLMLSPVRRLPEKMGNA